MLSRLAATLRERQGLGTAAPTLGGAVGEGGTIVLDENCLVSCFLLLMTWSPLAYKLSLQVM